MEVKKIAVIGMGYVGLPLACLFARKYKVVGFDVNKKKTEKLLEGFDDTGTYTEKELQASFDQGLEVTSEEQALDACNVFIVAVPTPVDEHHRVDLRPLLGASEVVGRYLGKGDVVIYESTVYPGATEDDCVPVLERESGLKFNEDFFAGYSPERVNPGDKVHTVKTIVKITSGSTPETATFVDKLYSSVLENGTYKAPSIRVAEAARIVENCQRDVNIAFMNEINRIFQAMDINTRDVLEAAATKWNFIKMEPGLVGGHCIGVDPYYLIQRAEDYSVDADLLSTARRVNERVGRYVADRVVNEVGRKAWKGGCNVLILGCTFKENCNDIRNSKVADIVAGLSEKGVCSVICDPYLDESEMDAFLSTVKMKPGKRVNALQVSPSEGSPYDAVILCVKHREFADLDVEKLLAPDGLLFDLKGFYRQKYGNKDFYREI